MMSEDKDLSIDGPGSPISLKKFLELDSFSDHSFQVLIDNTGEGIAKDDPHTMYMTPDACKEQAEFFLENFFTPLHKFPAYAARHIHFMYFDNSYRFKSQKEFLDHVNNDPENPEYKMVYNKFKYGKDNPEFLQILGLIMLFAGSLNLSKNEKKAVRLYIEHPETHMHPQRERLLMSMFHAIEKEFT